VDWAKIFRLRCARFSEFFFGVILGLTGWLLLLIETRMNSLINRTLLVIVLVGLLVLGSIIVTLAFIGESINGGADRLVYLLGKHSQTIETAAKARRLCRYAGVTHGYTVETPEEAEAMLSSAELIATCVADISCEGVQEPVKLLGYRCGVGMLAALYIIPVILFQRIAGYCQEEPYMCLMSDNPD